MVSIQPFHTLLFFLDRHLFNWYSLFRLFLRVCSQFINLFILLSLLFNLLSGLFVLVAEDSFFERSRLYVVIIEVDWLSM